MTAILGQAQWLLRSIDTSSSKALSQGGLVCRTCRVLSHPCFRGRERGLQDALGDSYLVLASATGPCVRSYDTSTSTLGMRNAIG